MHKADMSSRASVDNIVETWYNRNTERDSMLWSSYNITTAIVPRMPAGKSGTQWGDQTLAGNSLFGQQNNSPQSPAQYASNGLYGDASTNMYRIYEFHILA